MNEYRIFETRQFRQDLRSISRAGHQEVLDKLRKPVYPRLLAHPHFGPHIRKLKGDPGALTPSVDELPRLQSRHAAVMRFFQSVADTNDLDACVRVLEPEDVRAEFDLAFRRFSQSMDMLLPTSAR